MPDSNFEKELAHCIRDENSPTAVLSNSQGMVPEDIIVTGEVLRTVTAGNNSKLSLAYEELEEFPASLLSLSATLNYLDISNNKFKNLNFVCRFDFLTTLIADHNEITSNTVFPIMLNLKVLWLNHNRITALCPWLQWLHESCPNLKHLSLMGNPATEYCLDIQSPYHNQYKRMVLYWFPQLIHLDDSNISEEERKEVKANKTIRDRLSSGEIWEKWCRMPNMSITQQTTIEQIRKNKSTNYIV